MRVGFVCSTFDLLHPGHVIMLRTAADLCDELWVGLQTTVTDRPNKNKPVQTVYERFLQLDSMEFIKKILPYESENDLLNMLKTMPLHTRFLGADYMNKDFTGKYLYDYVFSENDNKEIISQVTHHNAVCYLRRDHGWSSTELRLRILEAERAKNNNNKEAENGHSQEGLHEGRVLRVPEEGSEAEA